MIDRAVTLNLYNSGVPLSEIGNMFGVSRQRIWQIVKPFSQSVIKRYPPGTKEHSTKEEQFIYDLLIKKGFVVKKQDYNAPFDLLVNGKKVEIKYRSKPDLHEGSLFYKFNYLKGREDVDFYIFICGKIIENIYIVPNEKVRQTYLISANPHNKQAKRKARLYKENWHRLVTGR